MRSPDHGPSSLSRRALLGGAAGAAASYALPASAGASPPPSLTVMTRNLYLGVDLSRLFHATSMDEVAAIAGDMLARIRSHPFEARVEAVAAEVAGARPHVIGVQEAATIRVQDDSDFSETPGPNASTEVVDLLELFASKLRARGLDYDVAAATVTTDVEVPADDDGGQTDVRLTDRTAVLVRSDVETTDARSDTFFRTLSYRLRGATVAIRRGFCLVDVSVDGADVTVANAHLESADDDARQAQAAELLDELPTDRPVVLAGDLNSGPGGPTGAYDLLTESFEDPSVVLGPDDVAPTCCQSSDLRDEEAQFTRRVDHVLARGDLEPTAVETVGADPDSRVTADVDGETVRLWPSDHAGVVATFELDAPTPTATQTASRTPTATSSPEVDSSSNIPLYGTLAGVVSGALAVLVWYRNQT